MAIGRQIFGADIQAAAFDCMGDSPHSFGIARRERASQVNQSFGRVGLVGAKNLLQKLSGNSLDLDISIRNRIKELVQKRPILAEDIGKLGYDLVGIYGVETCINNSMDNPPGFTSMVLYEIEKALENNNRH